VEAFVAESGIRKGLVNIYVQGASAGIMILFTYMYLLLQHRYGCLIFLLDIDKYI
jgi:hypothetical protein